MLITCVSTDATAGFDPTPPPPIFRGDYLGYLFAETFSLSVCVVFVTTISQRRVSGIPSVAFCYNHLATSCLWDPFGGVFTKRDYFVLWGITAPPQGGQHEQRGARGAQQTTRNSALRVQHGVFGFNTVEFDRTKSAFNRNLLLST
jgi:hypothetical protein